MSATANTNLLAIRGLLGALPRLKGGDAGEMLNKLILTRAKPIADVVFGVDNALWHKAHAANVLDAYNGPAARRPSVAEVGAGVYRGNTSDVAAGRWDLVLEGDAIDRFRQVRRGAHFVDRSQWVEGP